MIKDWKRCKIEDVALVGDGAHASIKRKESGVMYFTSKNFDLNGLKLDKVDYISEEDYKKYFNANSKALTKPKKNDVLLSIIGTMGAPYLVKGNEVFGLSSSVSILRPKKEIVDSKFLYYWIKSDYFQKSINSIKSGVAQSFLSLGMIRSLPCFLPPLPTQRKIASILSAYDDLIENNIKRIKLLEEKAQLTYEEWFVRMKFPGHENAVIDKESGLPEGWEKGKIIDLLELQRGFDLPIQKRIAGKIPIYASTGITDMHNEYKVSSPGIVTGRSGTLGKVQYIQNDFWPLNTTLWIKKFKKATPIFAFHFLKYFNLARFGGGSAVPSLDRKVVHAQRIRIPSSNLIAKFEKNCTPIMKNIDIVINQNRLLKEARDILLPRLMTGMIEVDKIEIGENEELLMEGEK